MILNTLLKIFGPVGERTRNILATVAGILSVIRPILEGKLPQLTPDSPAVTLPWPGIPEAIPYLDWLMVALVALAGAAFVDKFSPKRNTAIFGQGTEEIVPTVKPVTEVVAAAPTVPAATAPETPKVL